MRVREEREYEGTRVRGYEGTRVRGYEGTRVRGYWRYWSDPGCWSQTLPWCNCPLPKTHPGTYISTPEHI